MTDNPYALDPFSQVTDVHWGTGDWFVAYASFGGSIGGLDSVATSVSFPGEAGGTPGLPLISFGQIPPPLARAEPYVLLAKDLTAKLRTAAGKTLNGFPVLPGGTTSAAYFVNLNSFFPQTPFEVDILVQGGDGTSTLHVEVWTHAAKDIKAGVSIGFETPTPAHSAVQFGTFGHIAGTYRFSVDPKSLGVSSL